MPATNDQISRALDPVDGEAMNQDTNPDSPMMPFPTSYRLTATQEAELVDYAMQRKLELEREMGRDVCGGGNWWGTGGVATPDPLGVEGPQNTWMGKRILYDKTFKNEMGWRAGVMGGIFLKSNLCVTVARDIARKMIARANSFFFGTSPWFALFPVGAMDKTRAEKADRYVRWKMDVAGLQEVQESAIAQSFIVGEAVVKTEWAQREQFYETDATVLVDEKGADILGADGDYIMQTDLWIRDSVIDEATDTEVMADLFVLKRDGITPKPVNLIWVEKLVTRRIVHYKGPEAQLVHYLDFLCGLTEKSIQEAECCVHIYDMPLMTLADQWKKSAAANATAEQRVEATVKATEALRKLDPSEGMTQAAQNSEAVDSSTANGQSNHRRHPVIEIAEFHLRYDIDGRGLRDIVLVVDAKSQFPIFYDYEANVTADGLRPFSCIRPVRVNGRWYGSGAMELMNPSQEILDLWFNRKNFAVSNGGRADFWNPELTKEGAANPHLKLNWGGTWTKANKDTKASEILESVYLTDTIGEKLMEMMEFVMQIMMNGSGVANANDGNAANMDSTKLATGIRNVEKSGQELFSVFISSLDPGVVDVLRKMYKLLFVNLDSMEVYRYFEEGEAGGEGGEELMQIDPADIANLEMDVRILLSRHRGEQIVESSLRAWDVMLKYFDPNVSPEVQARLRPLANDILKAYQIQDADKITEPLTMPPGMGLPSPGMDPAAAAQAVPTGPPSQSQPNL